MFLGRIMKHISHPSCLIGSKLNKSDTFANFEDRVFCWWPDEAKIKRTDLMIIIKSLRFAKLAKFNTNNLALFVANRYVSERVELRKSRLILSVDKEDQISNTISPHQGFQMAFLWNGIRLN